MVTRMMWIAWPAFMAACVLELMVFAVVDPAELQWAGHNLRLSRQAAYTFAFFAFWIVCSGACVLTTLLRLEPAELNRCPYPRDQRPAACPGESGAMPL
ncbi:hypothetical protein [Ramlibacter alkalitolerans]|uniref:Transmembrane protein n=1 Tax=Ramlibacter alkalitolerans TaxID=2039631 RepID=A0ABS1JPF4_9BURK|nr:hypothetical protein [Ramlibacter alkalitolerans]MBL0426026.1 hypothetical protein [Ramlibacter alkalitolerans]